MSYYWVLFRRRGRRQWERDESLFWERASAEEYARLCVPALWRDAQIIHHSATNTVVATISD